MRGANARRAQDGNMNEKIPPQVPQGPLAPNEEGSMFYVEIRAPFKTFTHFMITQA